RAAADDENRRVVQARLRERGHRVGHARACGYSGDAALARDLRPALCREGGGLLVPHIDDSNAVLFGPDEDRPDMPAVEGEEMRDARALERERHQLSGVPAFSQPVKPTA